MIKKDFTNQQLGCIIALEPTADRAKGNQSVIWKCKCLKCNSEIFLSAKQLARSPKSCPACKIKSEIGKQYGYLTVKEYYPKDKPGRFWKCQCSCGNTTIVSTAALHSGRTRSCGCLQKEIASQQYIDMTNQTVGRWKVIKKVEQKAHSHLPTKWLCECSCENHTQREISGVELRRGTTLSCGCLRISHGEYKIAALLRQAGIPFETEKKFTSCKFASGISARFDFWVNNTYLIEFDGIQHYKNINYFTDNLEENQYRDEYKNQWCKENHIPLIRIPYTHLADLELKDLLLESSQFIVK